MAIELLYPPYPAGTEDIPDALRDAFESAATPSSYAPPQNLGLAMVARPFDETAVVDLYYPPYPAGFVEGVVTVSSPVRGAAATVVASTHGYNSQAADTPASTHFPPIMAEGFNFGAKLFEGTDPVVGGKTASVDLAGRGTVILADPAGELDSAARSYCWDGRELAIWRGSNSAAFSTWTRVAKLTTEGLYYGQSSKTMRLRDMQWRLYGARLLDQRYDGTGGINGDAGVSGQLRPQAYGRVFNVLPRLIDATNFVYQWHDRAVSSFTAARDGASTLVIDGDSADLTALLAASISTGHVRTCNALGLIRLGATPGLSFRIDGYGDAYSVNATTYVETRGAIVRRLATTRGSAPFADSSELDTVAFSLLDSRQPWPVGFWFDGDISVGDAIDTVMMGCAGWWFVGLDGLLTVSDLRAADVTPDVLLLHPADLKSEPEMIAWTAPRWQTRMGWSLNYAPQGPADLGSSTPTQQRLYGDQWRWGVSTDDYVRTKYPTASSIDVPGAFATEAGAISEASRQQQLFGVRRERWRVRVRLDPFANLLGKTLRLDSLNSTYAMRYGWSTSKLFRIVGIAAVAGLGEVELELWC